MAVNFANADMVGHTGNTKATIKAVETVDKCLGKLWKVLQKKSGNLVVTSDHGNADCMWDKKANLPMTFHTKNPVPLIIASETLKRKKLASGGVLGNITPTICDIMGTDKLKEMSKKSLF